MIYFAIYDVKVNAYVQPFSFKHSGYALRAFERTVQDPNTDIAKHPEDFVLYQLASFDETKGTFTNLKEPIAIGRAIEYVNRAVNTPESNPDLK